VDFLKKLANQQKMHYFDLARRKTNLRWIMEILADDIRRATDLKNKSKMEIAEGKGRDLDEFFDEFARTHKL